MKYDLYQLVFFTRVLPNIISFFLRKVVFLPCEVLDEYLSLSHPPELVHVIFCFFHCLFFHWIYSNSNFQTSYFYSSFQFLNSISTIPLVRTGKYSQWLKFLRRQIMNASIHTRRQNTWKVSHFWNMQIFSRHLCFMILTLQPRYFYCLCASVAMFAMFSRWHLKERNVRTDTHASSSFLSHVQQRIVAFPLLLFSMDILVPQPHHVSRLDPRRTQTVANPCSHLRRRRSLHRASRRPSGRGVRGVLDHGVGERRAWHPSRRRKPRHSQPFLRRWNWTVAGKFLCASLLLHCPHAGCKAIRF